MPISLNECYVILGLNKPASAEEINAAFKQLALIWHPDKAGSKVELLEKINNKISAVQQRILLKAFPNQNPPLDPTIDPYQYAEEYQKLITQARTTLIEHLENPFSSAADSKNEYNNSREENVDELLKTNFRDIFIAAQRGDINTAIYLLDKKVRLIDGSFPVPPKNSYWNLFVTIHGEQVAMGALKHGLIDIAGLLIAHGADPSNMLLDDSLNKMHPRSYAFGHEVNKVWATMMRHKFFKKMPSSFPQEVQKCVKNHLPLDKVQYTKIRSILSGFFMLPVSSLTADPFSSTALKNPIPALHESLPKLTPAELVKELEQVKKSCVLNKEFTQALEQIYAILKNSDKPEFKAKPEDKKSSYSSSQTSRDFKFSMFQQQQTPAPAKDDNQHAPSSQQQAGNVKEDISSSSSCSSSSRN